MRNPFYHRQGITDPSCFYGRGALVRSLFEMIDSGQSCAVVGERRIGKSSLLAYLTSPEVQAFHHLASERTLTAMLDFLALHTCSPSELWLEILETLELATEDPQARQILERAIEPPNLDFGTFRRALRKLKRRGFRVVLLCDEFELAVQNPQFDTAFFGALRSLAGSEGVVFVTASRSSLLELGQYREEEVRQKVLGSPFFNIFAEFTVGPFSDYEVAEMLAGSLDPTPIRLDRDAMKFLDQIAGRHPYFLQLASYHLYEGMQRAGLGRSTAGSAGTLSLPEIRARTRKCRSAVRDQVRRESAKIFRNQWQHSSDAEKRALVALAAQSEQEPDNPEPDSGVLGGRTLARLERRGLVKEVPRVASSSPHTYAQTHLNSQRFQLFSELLVDWLIAGVELPPTTEPVAQPRDPVEGLPRPPAADTTVPKRYHLLEEIGHGGAGTVYKAWDERLERLVAIKVLDPELRSSPERLEPLLVEARTCAALHHPHIVTVFDIDTANGFLVQEFLAGGSLRDLLEMVPALAAADILTLAEELGAALGAAHRAGVIHRDLKPENVLLTARPTLRGPTDSAPILPTVKLADFGTALRFNDLDQIADRHSLAGTLTYMAPEQLTGQEIGPAADFYALGVVLFEARRGLRPPKDSTDATTLPALDRTSIQAPELDEIISRCLTQHPQGRFPTAEELLNAAHNARKSLAKVTR